jgi:hypothetical protein
MKMKVLAAVAAATLALAAGAAQAATLKASYLFNNNLSSSVGGAPDLVLTDPTGTSAFQTDTVFGESRTVLFIGGTNANADQGGLTFNSTGLLTSNSYSVALTFEFLDGTNRWRRIVDVEGRTSDNGFYVDPSNNLNVFPVNGSNAGFTNNQYRNVALTVGPGGEVKAYIDGGASLTSNTNIMNIGPNGLINLFLDNTQAGGQREWSRSRIAVANFYDGVLTSDEVFGINQNPTGAVPEPATWAMMIMGFGAAGAMMRRRRDGGATYRLEEAVAEGRVLTEEFAASDDTSALSRVASVVTGEFKLWRGDILVRG